MEVISVDMKPIIASSLGSEAQTLASNVKSYETKIPRPTNAFMIFGKEFRKVLSTKFPEFSNKQISKILGEEWKRMNAERKNHYHRLADEVHKQHLIKYPGYYYSPLEARLRKAERKRKSKMSKNSRKSNGIQTTYLGVQQFGQQICQQFGQQFNRPFLMRGTYPMVRPMFCSSLPARHGNSLLMTQPVIHYGPDRPFGGCAPQISFQGFRQQLRPTIVGKVCDEHNYAISLPQQPQPEFGQQMTCETNTDSQLKQCEHQLYERSDYEMEKTNLSSLMTQYLPPMHNPSTEVTPVFDTESTEKKLKDHKQVIKMSNAMTDNEVLPSMKEDDLLKQLVAESLFEKVPKVVVERVDSHFSNDASNSCL